MKQIDHEPPKRFGLLINLLSAGVRLKNARRTDEGFSMGVTRSNRNDRFSYLAEKALQHQNDLEYRFHAHREADGLARSRTLGYYAGRLWGLFFPGRD